MNQLWTYGMRIEAARNEKKDNNRGKTTAVYMSEAEPQQKTEARTWVGKREPETEQNRRGRLWARGALAVGAPAPDAELGGTIIQRRGLEYGPISDGLPYNCVFFWTSLGGVSIHYNALSSLDPNFKVPPCTHLRLNWHGKSNHMHDLWCPPKQNIKAFSVIIVIISPQH